MDSGLAGKSVGGAMVSPKHCGFIINYDNATSTDVYELINAVRDTVYKNYNVTLETEVRLLGEF
jgi:UDP-N-acetylmuramate dehydrogenase